MNCEAEMVPKQPTLKGLTKKVEEGCEGENPKEIHCAASCP